MMFRNDINAQSIVGFEDFLLVSVLRKSRHFSNSSYYQRKSSIFIKKSVLRHFKQLEREEKREKKEKSKRISQVYEFFLCFRVTRGHFHNFDF